MVCRRGDPRLGDAEPAGDDLALVAAAGLDHVDADSGATNRSSVTQSLSSKAALPQSADMQSTTLLTGHPV